MTEPASDKLANNIHRSMNTVLYFVLLFCFGTVSSMVIEYPLVRGIMSHTYAHSPSARSLRAPPKRGSV